MAAVIPLEWPLLPHTELKVTASGTRTVCLTPAEVHLNKAMTRRGKPGSWKAVRLSTRPDQLVRVGKGAQEQFLEYAHYLPERSVQAAVDRQKLAGFAVLESTELAQDMDAEQVGSRTSAPSASGLNARRNVFPHAEF